MQTEVYGQIPVFSRQQVRKLYAETVKAGFDNPEELVETGVMPFPKNEELKSYDQSVETGLNHALRTIEKQDVASLPEFFMIDTEEREGNKGIVWVIAGGEVVDFTKTPMLHESKITNSNT
jgi:hypothetical protein